MEILRILNKYYQNFQTKHGNGNLLGFKESFYLHAHPATFSYQTNNE